MLVAKTSIPDINGDVHARLKRILDRTSRGEITDFAMVYLTTTGPGFSHSYRHAKRMSLVGALELLKHELCQMLESVGTTEPEE